MTRIKRGFVSKNHHKNIIKFNKGFKGSHSKLFKIANQENMKALSYSFFDRRKKKRNFKSQWIKQINGQTRKNKINYSHFIHKMKILKITINRKVLAKISNQDEKTFDFILNLN
uniref:ribosomal protein L20 n=1 Tax=Phacus arnoldii TaxID=298292 RepID=UPI0023AA89AE|nr:ribosomal protein L20 [Phacus arnoldii]WCH63555.1 ribosomal protein L20 [Phacus arnoldii]